MLRKYNYLIYYLLPVIINVITIYFWYLWTPESAMPIFSFVFNTLLAPLYLASCNAAISNLSIKAKAGFSFLSISISSIITYCGWGIGTGRFSSPDAMTVYVSLWEFFIACIIASLGLISSYFVHSRANRDKR